MAARSLGSVTLCLELVRIPCRLYTAVASNTQGFNMLHAGCGSRLKQQLFCPVHSKVVERSETVQAFEYTPDRYVEFTADEIRALDQASDPDVLTIAEIVPRKLLDALRVKKSWFLGPNKGGHAGFALLGVALENAQCVAIGRYGDALVAVRPFEDGRGLSLHELFVAADVRPYAEVPNAAEEIVDAEQLELASTLLMKKFTDRSALLEDGIDAGEARLKVAVTAKVAGEEVVVPPPAKGELVVDIAEALELSIARTGAKRGPKKASAKPEKRRARAAG